MLIDAVPFSQFEPATPVSFKAKAIKSLVELLEKTLGISAVYNTRDIPFERPDLAEVLRLASNLKRHGILTSLIPGKILPDEPPMKIWGATDSAGNNAGGTSPNDDTKALMATLAESLERYLWHTQTDYFEFPVRATTAQISRRGRHIAPERFAAFSDEQRAERPHMQLHADSQYLWIRGRSLVQRRPIYVPAQVISGVKGLRNHAEMTEPLIRMQITTGLATWPTIEGARLAGALEVIEREAYMIMWLNQITLPRISLSRLRMQNQSLSDLIASCERYRLRVHAIQLLTDAPTHAVCVVLEDMSGHAPRFGIGIRAHGSLDLAVEKAMTEALRARVSYRRHFIGGGTWDAHTPAQQIGHHDRIYYWGENKNAAKLEFLIRGDEKEIPPAPWEKETIPQQLERVVEWCRTSGFECASVSLGRSKKNPTSWSVEMVTIPELQPLYLSEKQQELGGNRWRSVPEKFGITPRNKPFSEEPQPFA